MANVKNWRTSLGGSIQTIGTGLFGFSVQQGMTDMAKAEQFEWMLITGFILNLVGQQVTALFSADAQVVTENLREQRAINVETDVAMEKMDSKKP